MSRLIYTINSRGSVYLEVIKSYFHFSDENMHEMINGLHDALLIQLQDKGLSYKALKPALIPHKDRKELVLVCDSSQIDDNFYGEVIWNQVLKAFDIESVNSIMQGDYIDTINNYTSQKFLHDILNEVIDISDVQYGYSSQLFFIYIQNVSSTLEQQLYQCLQGQDWFVGIADVSYMSRFKTFISTILTFNMIKYKNILIQSTPDYSQNEDENRFLYDFESFGFQIKNIEEELFLTFLDYKIERPYFHENDLVDQIFSLNAITPIFKRLQDCEIIVPEAKLEYLKQYKGGTLHNIGLTKILADELREIIRDRINSNYLYSLKYDDTFETLMFNIMLEFSNETERHKIVLGLKYIKKIHTIQLVTMF